MLDVSVNTKNPFAARWTQTGNNLCLGHWDITYEGRPLDVKPPHSEDDMGTYGIFSYIFPDDPELAEGLDEDDWILENIIWVSDLFGRHDIPIDEAHMRWFYRAVNANDWRCGSCGGCL
jgi:hypothetical protein